MKKKIILSHPEQKNLAIEIILGLPVEPVHQMEIKPYKSSRSLAQNNLFHMWCRQLSLDYAESHGKFYSPSHWKIYMKELFLGYESTDIMGKIITELRKTSKLNVKEFTEFLEQVDMYAGSEMGIILSHPEDLYRESMGRHQ